jgi:hypothetical protein
VAIERADGSLLHTVGEDGMLLVDGRKFRKVHAADDYARIGNQAPSEHSPIVLGDYKVDEDAELERPTRVSLIDTRTATLRLVDVVAPWREPVEWQSPRPALFVLGDTAYVTEPATRELHAIDLATRRVTATHHLPEIPDELTGTAG